MIEKTTVTLRAPRETENGQDPSRKSTLFSTSYIIENAPDEDILDFAEAVNDLQTTKYTEVIKSTQFYIYNN